MKKEEFLNELEQRLDILSDGEKQDIIAEYSQHIDIKIETGLSEEAAAGDFGDIKELADEILNAYNVNLKYNKAKKGKSLRPPIEKGLKAMLRLLNKGKSKVSIFLKKCGNGIIRCGKAMGRFCKARAVKAKGFFCAIGIRLSHVKKIEDNALQLAEMDDVSKDEKTQKKIDLKKGKEHQKAATHINIGNMARRLAGSIFHCIKRIWHWFVLLCILCAALPFAICGGIGLLILGFLLVLIPQGYPIVGITIIAVGGCLIVVSILGILLSFWGEITKVPIRKIMAMIMAAGIFITGIGTGISFLEYTGLEYGGKQILYEGESTTDVFTLAFSNDTKGKALTVNDHTDSTSCRINVVGDPYVSPNEIVFEITYNKGFGRPIVEKHKAKENMYNIMEDNEDGKSELEILMDYKNSFLKDIKNGKISEYIMENRWDCNIKLSPENANIVRDYF